MQLNILCNRLLYARLSTKMLPVMKLTALLLLVSFLQVSAQSPDQTVTYSTASSPLTTVFASLKQQTGFVFFYDKKDLEHSKPVTVQFKKMPLKTALQTILSPQGLNYEIQGNTIVISKSETPAKQDITQPVTGLVKGPDGHPLAGISVAVKGYSMGAITDAQGRFDVTGHPGDVLVLSGVGYYTKELKITGGEVFDISLQVRTMSLDTASITFSTGYQSIPKERATGSFEIITKEQLQHSTDPNLLRRLEGITTSMDFRNDLRTANSSNPNAKKSPLTDLTIRGKNTLNYSTANNSGQVLVVIDGIASPYSIDKVNPNDVESITILKDAAAASIWGSRAANGVIVVKTKKGAYNRPLQVTFNSNVSVTKKIDLYYNKTMSIPDFIDAQMLQFTTADRPLPEINISQLYGQQPVSPVAEIMDAWKNKNTLTEAQAMAQINALRSNDIRRDYTRYFLRDAVTQSYSLAADGGSKAVNYRFSGGYDKSINNTKGSGADRFAIGYNMAARPVKNLELQANISYNLQRTNDQAAENRITGATDATFYPYTRLTDDAGNPLAIGKTYRPGLIDLMESTYGDKLLSFRYKPLEDINEGYNKVKSQNVNINLGASYRLLESLSFQLTYNYNNGRDEDNTLYRQNSFYMRNLINYFTTSPYSTDPETYEDVPDFVRSLPLGGLYQTNLTKSSNQTARGQINFDKTIHDKHQVTAIAGIDIAQNYSLAKADQYYGYNERTKENNANIDYSKLVPILFSEDFNGYNGEYIPKVARAFTDTRIRTFSYYANAAYTYDRRYTLSASTRKDLSSEFGQGTNKKGTPYFSVGAGWNISNEAFYHPAVFSMLKLRATFGYNGNVNPLVIARPIITYINYGNNGVPYAETQLSGSVSNSLLRPEKTGIFNLGIDYTVKGERLSGSMEYYNKKTKDLLANGALDPSTGYTNAIYNTGNLSGYGIDLTLNSLNLQTGKFRWNSNFLFSYNRVKVSKLYASSANTAGSVVSNSSGSYNQGFDLSRVFGYKWAGLDPLTGDPRGYVNKEVVSISNNSAGSANYRAIQNAPVADAHYFGSAVPVFYGSFRNTLTYAGFSLSANLLYKLGYYIRRPVTQVVKYSALFTSTGTLQGEEYANRWQKAGDEKITNVPSAAVTSNDQSRDNFYYYSDINVIKGDHVRLQEINLSYMPSLKIKFLKNPRIYANANNLGIIWKANKQGIDPEVFDLPVPKSYSLGFSANF
ncbi:SusC/RagA family TonB-linked outer membrane protein [Chitinophaga oryziterrae]|uniref:SusC/RagA family TonB-linked outer membrane protein n=2 Tax=Chitinophaga oryziterrae TaxID=1031224 RepID=A0A6N8JFG6_9BACT|nr:SusC/RagA family TonB-linked outer membrane protein [Chitinophaga oryziterrae]